MKCDELKAMSAVDAYEEYENNIIDESRSYDVYNKQDVDEAIGELKAKLCVEKKYVCQLEQLFQKQKEKADKLYHCLNGLVRRDLIKDCPTKEVAAKIVKEFQ